MKKETGKVTREWGYSLLAVMGKENGVELEGRLVMVRPELVGDNLKRQGQMGRITYVIPDGKNVVVQFSDGFKGRYSMDDVLTLYPKTLILQGLTTNSNMPIEEYQLIHRVFRLSMIDNRERALELAMTNEAARFFCTNTCAVWLEMKLNARLSKGKQRKI